MIELIKTMPIELGLFAYSIAILTAILIYHRKRR